MRGMTEEQIDKHVTNEALNRMVGREFDMLEYVLERAIIRSEMREAEEKAGEESP